MPKWKDRTGDKFGRLTAIEYIRSTENTKKAIWRFRCECGNEIEARYDKVKNGNYVSCGCLRKERNTTHGMRYTRVYSIWCDMKKRCNNKNNVNFSSYGGRGIKVCEEWNDRFETFYDWSINNGYNDELTIDRIDVNGNYEPDNCRWVSMDVQCYNKRNTIFVDVNGEQKTLKEIIDEYGLTYSCVYSRYKRGQFVVRDGDKK